MLIHTRQELHATAISIATSTATSRSDHIYVFCRVAPPRRGGKTEFKQELYPPLDGASCVCILLSVIFTAICRPKVKRLTVWQGDNLTLFEHVGQACKNKSSSEKAHAAIKLLL